MRIVKTIVMALCTAFAVSGAVADETSALIELDKAWGMATSAGEADGLIADGLIAVDEDGIGGKAEQLAAITSSDAPTGPYVAGDYKVDFLDSNTAIMVHSAGAGEDAHWSMHVWRKNGGKWQVAATASVEADDD
jgi:hypothetical protein